MTKYPNVLCHSLHLIQKYNFVFIQIFQKQKHDWHSVCENSHDSHKTIDTVI